MKKTIRIIDLLNLIANGEEVPKKIMYGLTIWFYDNNAKDYFKDSDNAVSFQMTYVSNRNWLNLEVEILDEEEFEDIYNFCWNENYLFSNRQTGMTKEDRRLLDSNFKDIHDTINQLIKNQKKIIEKLNKNNIIQ